MTNGDYGRTGRRWIRADLHVHTPASEDYAEPQTSYLEILQEAERRELQLLAFTDHNTVNGYAQLHRELEFLETLERANRLTPEEQTRLSEYRRLLSQITVLPGFEFTSHFGAHILGIFAPTTPLSLIEATLLQLGVPAEQLKHGVTAIPNTRHVTEAYEIIARNGGMVIAAHANGPNGVITETLRMGTSGQSRIAATQSPHLSALEFINFYTDHEKFTSPSFYSGKVEHYERRMFCIQGSDAHRLRRAPDQGQDPLGRHGIGDRYVEFQLAEPSFAALKELFGSQQFDRVRVPKRDQKQWEVDTLRSHTAPAERQVMRAETDADLLWRDVAALANSGGGTLIIGGERTDSAPVGVARPEQTCATVRAAVEQLTPQPHLAFELLHYEGKDLIRLEVKAPEPPPYVGADGVTYVRRAGETAPASRAELLQLCRRALAEGATTPLDNGQDLDFPRSGVEIVAGQKRGGAWLYEVRDLRTTVGVSRDRAQGLWAYAIGRYEDVRDGRIDVQSQIRWQGRVGLWRAYRQGHRVKYDLVHRNPDGQIDHIFFGVSDWGLSERWQALLAEPVTEEVPETETPLQDDEPTAPLTEQPIEPAADWAERRYRWRGRGGLLQIRRVESDIRFDLAMKEKDRETYSEYRDVPREKLSDAWLNMIRVPPPRTGIEVVSAAADEDGQPRFVFCNLRTGETSTIPWRLQDIEEGTIRQYAARMAALDAPLDEERVRWWGNIGYLRPMRSQVDLVYRDENGVDHCYYAARRDELQGEWRAMLEEYGDL